MNLEAKTNINMSLSGLGIAYLVFGCLLPVLLAEIYYLLWWKKRRPHNTEIEVQNQNQHANNGFLYRFFWKTHSSSPMNVTRKLETKSNNETADLEMGLGLEESVDSEIMRLHNLAGPPRFLFTIKEETKEDLESEDGKSKGSRSKSLSDLMAAIDSSFIHHGISINPLFESSPRTEETDSEILNRFRSSSSSSSSPPPKFKFLRDAEEKLQRRLIEEAQRNSQNSYYKESSFFRLIKSKDRDQLLQHGPQIPSSSSQVLPLD